MTMPQKDLFSCIDPRRAPGHPYDRKIQERACMACPCKPGGLNPAVVDEWKEGRRWLGGQPAPFPSYLRLQKKSSSPWKRRARHSRPREVRAMHRDVEDESQGGTCAAAWTNGKRGGQVE
jgi:hypothetical protein